MKSKKLSSDFTVFRKDITRFSPIWLLWCGLFLLIGYLAVNSETDITLTSFPTMFTYANLIYGICCAVFLFGYLSDQKECIMTHCLPIRRETLFFIHLLAGLLMQMVPTALFCLSMIPSSSGNLFALFGLLVLQFVFFYGLGIFCVMLTGRKFAAVVLYGLINAAAPLLFFAINTLYIPLLPGLELSSSAFMRFCPLVTMIYRDFSQITWWSFADETSAYLQHVAVIASVGVGLTAASLLLYRFRKLECAESFIAFPRLNVLFVLVCTIFCGCFFTIFSDIFSESSYWFMLVLGGVIGYFSSMMLLRHSSKVFGPKSLGGFALIAAVIAGSLFLTKMDPIGLVTRIPDPHQVVRAELYRYEAEGNSYFTEDPEEISKLMDLHQALIEQKPTDSTWHVELLYHMDDGSTMKRVYEASEPLHSQITWYMNQPEYMFHASNAEEILHQYEWAILYLGSVSYQLTPQEQDELLRALFADCKAGRMNSETADTAYTSNSSYSVELLHVPLDSDRYSNAYTQYFSVYPESVETYGWITQYVKNHRISQ